MASALARAHILGEKRLRDLASGAVERIWNDLPGHDRADLDEWLSRVLPLAAAAQRQSASLTEAYLARALERQPLGINLDGVTGAAVRNGTDPATVYERPFVTLWAKLGEGTAWDLASSAALARATGTVAMDVQLAMRATAGAVERADDGIFGYERIANPGACTFCGEVDGAYVKSGDAMSLHPACGCSLEPLTAPHSRAAAAPPAGVAVHDHGELGAMLGSADHDFTSETDI